MDMGFDAADRAFREEVRAFLAAELPDHVRHKVVNGLDLKREDLIGWHKTLAKRGWVAPNWPKEYGGPGWTITQRYIFDEEIGLAGAPRLIVFGLNMCAPVLMAFGTPEQKAYYLPRILSAEDVWCQGYSEPGSGSDLASLRTKAEIDGDHFVVNGSKIWTTRAHMANKVFLLVRTRDTGRKQEGISFILVDMDTPGIELRPIHILDGLHETNQVFFTDVRVPRANLVGEIDQGWTIAKYLLGHERMSGGGVGSHKFVLRQLKEIAARDERNGGAPLMADPDFRRNLAEAEIELKAVEAYILRALDGARADRELGAEANIIKIRQTEVHQRLTELRMEAVGYYGVPYSLPALLDGWGNQPPVGAEYANGLAPSYFHHRKVSIYSGSNEIQHNIIAKAQLGL